MNSKTHYETLGVPPSASNVEIRDAYVALARVHHPDAGGNEDVMAELNRAYTTLKNDRKSYNQWLQMTMRACPKCRAKGTVPSGFKARKKCPTCNGAGYTMKT